MLGSGARGMVGVRLSGQWVVLELFFKVASATGLLAT